MVQSTAAERRRTRAERLPRRGPVDLVHLTNQTLGDRGLELEVLRMFDVTARTYFSRIESSTSVDELLRHLHTLKGAAAGIGAVAIRDLAAAAERDLRNGKPVNPERIDDIVVAVADGQMTFDELTLWMKSRLIRV